MNYKNKKKIYDFWKKRINIKNFENICTNDKNLDILETAQILNENLNRKSILEVGCGNGLLYQQIKKKFKIKNYLGFDFVDELVNLCNKNNKNNDHRFIKFDLTQVKENSFNEKFDYIISKRVIQNIVNTKLQLKLIDNLGLLLKKNGYLILVESSSTAQRNINCERKIHNLNKIVPPFHNLFFDDVKIKKYKFKNINLLKIVPFSSDFYFLTRIIYPIYSKFYLKKNLSLNHPFQKIALDLSLKSFCSTNKYSQIQKYIFKKS